MRPFLGVSIYVRVEAARLSEPFFANRTRVFPFFGVSHHVNLQTGLCDKLFGTMCTIVGLLAHMTFIVISQVRILRVTFSANIANVVPLTSVNQLMSFHVLCARERFATDRTLHRFARSVFVNDFAMFIQSCDLRKSTSANLAHNLPLWSVNHQMILETRLFRKCFLAYFAHKRLQLQMHRVYVSVKIMSLRKLFAACSTDVWFSVAVCEHVTS